MGNRGKVTYPSLSIPRTKTTAPARTARAWAMSAGARLGCWAVTVEMMLPVKSDMTATGPIVILA